MKSHAILFVSALCITLFSFGQEHESVLQAPENWPSEIIPFPIGFAQSIEYKGFEDLRFAPGWRDTTSQEFWTYCFVWYIEKDAPLTEGKLTEMFNSYYDGLMGIDSRSQMGKEPQKEKTASAFRKSKKGFSGTMRTYDAFTSKKYMTLNIKVEEWFCPKSNKQIIRCNISPKPFKNKTWQLFKEVKVIVECK